jgi:hypothetical protein
MPIPANCFFQREKMGSVVPILPINPDTALLLL